MGLAKDMERVNPHLVYPTSIYQTAGGNCFSSSDSSKIEAFLTTQKTSSIRIESNLLSTSSITLRDLYKPLTRCVAVVDKTVFGLWGDKISNISLSTESSLHAWCTEHLRLTSI